MNVEKTGAYLASLRKGRDMTQQQVADILGVSNKTVSKWESGAGLPDIGALPALAALYGVTADDILAGETRPRAVSDDNVQREVETYLERRGKLRFRIGYAATVMVMAVGLLFRYASWAWLLLLAAALFVWLGWSPCRSKDDLRRRLVMLLPPALLWSYIWVAGLLPYRKIMSLYTLHGGVVRREGWADLTLRQESVWFILPLLAAGLLALCGAILKEPLLRSKPLRWTAYGGCALVLAVELGRCIACWDAAAAYAAYPTSGVSRGQQLYAELTDAAAPWGTARWIAVAAVVIACVVLAIAAHKRAKQN